MQFTRHIGIDYSGAQVPNVSLKGLRIYCASGTAPEEVVPPAGPRKYWSRRGVAEWLVERLNEGIPTLVGIDHGFSFPRQYFEAHGLGEDWTAFLEDFRAHWPTDQDHMYVDFIRDGMRGNGAARSGKRQWRRLAEERAGAAKSVFFFDVQGQVAKSTHAGLPWLLYLRRQVRAPLHFWPFDGWEIPSGSSAVVEVYPSLWSRDVPKDGRSDDQHDAYVVAEWLRTADRDRRLPGFWNPPLTPEERRVAGFEGWILGVMGARTSRARTSVIRPAAAASDALVGAKTFISEDVAKRSLQTWLEKAGWTVALAWGHTRGIDIDARRAGQRWVIEVKGEGSRQQMRVNYFLGMLGELLQRMNDPSAAYSIALPDLPQFRGLWDRLPRLAKERTGISALFVTSAGDVEEVK
jgi:hypothetical protein